MQQQSWWPWQLITLAALAVVGCGGSAATKDEPVAKAEAEAVKRVPEAKLKPLVADTALPPIDDGRVEVFPPKGWTASSSTLDVLIWFKRDKSTSKLPRINIKAEDVSAEMANSTEENVVEFKTWASTFLTSKDEHFSQKLLEQLKPMMIGNKACVRYVLKAEVDRQPAERQVLHTLHEGRLYSVNLDVEDSKELQTFRDEAYAVMANLKFKGGGLPVPAVPAAAPKAEAPKDAKPAEKK